MQRQSCFHHSLSSTRQFHHHHRRSFHFPCPHISQPHLPQHKHVLRPRLSSNLTATSCHCARRSYVTLNLLDDVIPRRCGSRLNVAAPSRLWDKSSRRSVLSRTYSRYIDDKDVPDWQRRLIKTFPLLRYSDIIKRCAITVLLLCVIRAGAFIPLPGIDMQRLPVNDAPLTEGEQMIKALYGQATELPASLFMLGISPFINASIVITIITALPPSVTGNWQWLQRLRDARKEGKGGEAAINKRVYNLALLFGVYLALVEAFNLAPYALFTKMFIPSTVLALVAGSCIIHACANLVTASGLGNGTTLVICTSIISGYADTLHRALTAMETSILASWQLAMLSGGYLLILLAVVVMNLTELRLPIVAYGNTIPQGVNMQSNGSQLIMARRLTEKKMSERNAENGTSYLPLQLNASGIMPIIVASATYYGLLPAGLQFCGLSGAAQALLQFQTTFPGLLVYGLLVFAGEFLPLGGVKPAEVAEYFSHISIGIRGWAPGQITQQNLEGILIRCKLWGGLALASIAVLAHYFDLVCASWLGTTLGTTNLLIVVGGVLQTTRQAISLAEGPRLQAQLDRERAAIQSLTAA